MTLPEIFYTLGIFTCASVLYLGVRIYLWSKSEFADARSYREQVKASNEKLEAQATAYMEDKALVYKAMKEALLGGGTEPRRRGQEN